jgi:hypothetical protein
MSDWTDSVVGERMQVDQEFSQQVQASEFTSQEWSLVMTAIEFEIEGAEDPDTASVAVDDSNLEQVIPEFDEIRSQMDAMGGMAGGSQSGGGGGGGGVMDSVKSALGLGGGDGDEDAEHERKEEAATKLTAAYAERFEARLRENGRWEEVCAIAAASEDATAPEEPGGQGDGAGDADGDET